MCWMNLSSFGKHLHTLIVISVMHIGLAVSYTALRIPPDDIPKIKFTPVNQSSVLPLVPERLVSPGWSQVPSALNCAHRTLAEFPASRGFLYSFVSEVCTPLLWLLGAGAENATELLPEEGTMYLADEVCRRDFQLLEYGDEGLLACVQVSVDSTTYFDARTFCNASHSHLMEVKTSEKVHMINSEFGAKDRWIGLDDIENEGTFVWQSDGTVLTEQQYSLFGKGDPNNNYGKEDCVLIGSSSVLWDGICGRKLGFVCEKTLPRLDCVVN